MRLYPLDKAPKVAAAYHADVHLRPGVVGVYKTLSDIAHIVGGSDIKIKTLADESVEHYFCDARILPPSGKTNIWAKWAAKNRNNAWFLVDMAFALHDEFRYRFKEGLPEYMKIQDMIMATLMMKIPQFGPDKDNRRVCLALEEFPLVLPHEEVLKLGEKIIARPVVNIYQAYYASIRGKIRMKWTGRQAPNFLWEVQPPLL